MNQDDRNRDTPRYYTSYFDRDFVGALRVLGDNVDTKAVAETVGCSRETARRRLNQLEEEGTVVREYIGQSAFWSLPSD